MQAQGQGGAQQPLLMVNGNALGQQMFSLLDGDGSGGISQSEFDAAFGQSGKTTQADSLFAKLDANADGSVSLDELKSALQGAGHHGHHHHMHAASSSFATDLAASLAPSDGSTDSTDNNSSDADSSTNQLRHLGLTVVPNPSINMVPIDPTGHVNTAVLDARLNQTLSISV